MARKWYSKTKEYNPEEAKQKREEKLTELNQQLQDGVERILNSEDLQEQIKAMLKFKSKFHQYSFGNMMRILFQNPHATYVAGFTTWTNTFKRKVKKGAKAIYVLAPVIVKKEDEQTGEEKRVIVGWKPEPVFDIAQTEETAESLPVPQGIGYELVGDTDPGRFLRKYLGELAKAEGITLEVGDTGRAGGYYQPSKHLIRLSSQLDSNDEEAMVLLHEMLHAFRHAKGSEHAGETSQRAEVVVEGAAFMTAAYFGLYVDDFSFAYVASWVKDVDTLLSLGAEVEKESKRMIDKIEALIAAEENLVSVNDLEDIHITSDFQPDGIQEILAG